jgi:hypothetical protein
MLDILVHLGHFSFRNSVTLRINLDPQIKGLIAEHFEIPPRPHGRKKSIHRNLRCKPSAARPLSAVRHIRCTLLLCGTFFMNSICVLREEPAVAKTHFSGEDRHPPKPGQRRAGLRPDERDPDEPPAAPGSATGGVHAAGMASGGMAGGGLAGANTADGSIEEPGLEDSLGSAISDDDGDTEGGPPYAGPAGGAVGGSPAEKRAKGGHAHR